MRKVLQVLGLVAVISCLCVAAMAQTTPPTVDWAAQGSAVKDGLTTLVNTLIPAGVAIMVLFFGPRIFRKIVKSFAN